MYLREWIKHRQLKHVFHVVFQMCCFIVPFLFGFCRFINCQTAIGRLITNVNQIFSCTNLLETLRKRNSVGLQCVFIQSKVPNNICKQCTAKSILFAFLLGSRERPLLCGMCLSCQSVSKFSLWVTDGDCSQTIMQVIMQTSCKRGVMEPILRALYWGRLQYELHSYCPHERGCCRCPKTRGKRSLRIFTSSASENSQWSEQKQ